MSGACSGSSFAPTERARDKETGEGGQQKAQDDSGGVKVFSS